MSVSLSSSSWLHPLKGKSLRKSRGDSSRIADATWEHLGRRFREEWWALRDTQRIRNQEQEGGPNYYVVRRHKLGAALLRFVDRNLSDGALTPTKAGKVLGVKPRSVAPLLSSLHQRVA